MSVLVCSFHAYRTPQETPDFDERGAREIAVVGSTTEDGAAFGLAKPDRTAVCRRASEPSRGSRVEDYRGHGRIVAGAISHRPAGRLGRRTSPGISPRNYRRSSGRSDHPHAGIDAAPSHSLEYPLDGSGDEVVALHGLPHLAGFRAAAASHRKLQAFLGPFLRGEGAGPGGVVREPARSRRGGVR